MFFWVKWYVKSQKLNRVLAQDWTLLWQVRHILDFQRFRGLRLWCLRLKKKKNAQTHTFLKKRWQKSCDKLCVVNQKKAHVLRIKMDQNKFNNDMVKTQQLNVANKPNNNWWRHRLQLWQDGAVRHQRSGRTKDAGASTAALHLEKPKLVQGAPEGSMANATFWFACFLKPRLADEQLCAAYTCLYRYRINHS